MNNFEFELHGRTYKRVPKNIARKIYDAGHPVLFCPCNLNPASPWRPGVTFDNTCKESFENAAILAEVSNCYDAETGRYLAYYVDTDAMAKVLGRWDVVNTYCAHCQDSTPVTIKPTTIAMNVDGLTIQFEGQMAVCDQCGHEATSQDCQQYNGRQFRAEINKPRLLNPKAALHARTTLHLSADYVAHCLNIPLAVFTAIETGACAATPNQLKALATTYLVEPDELINPDFAEPGTYRREIDDLRRHVRQITKV